MQSDLLLQTRDLHLSIHHRTVLANVSFELHRKECMAIMGRSGSGKTSLGRALVGLLPHYASIDGALFLAKTPNSYGSITPDACSQTNLLHMPPHERRRKGYATLGYMTQHTSSALNPIRTVWQHMCDAVYLSSRIGQNLSFTQKIYHGVGFCLSKEQEHLIDCCLKRAHLHVPLKRFAHQLSGGESQRLMFAMVLATQPKILIADEPTTAMDLVRKSHLFDLLQQEQQNGLGILLFTHDVDAVRVLAPHNTFTLEMCQQMDEQDCGFSHPDHRSARGQSPYSGLKFLDHRDHELLLRLDGKNFTPPACDIHMRVHDLGVSSLFNNNEQVLRSVEATQGDMSTVFVDAHPSSVAYTADHVHFSLRPYENISLLGESGSGKTTIGRALVGLGSMVPVGKIFYRHLDIAVHTAAVRSSVYYMAQQAHDALNPDYTMGKAIMEGWHCNKILQKIQHSKRLPYTIQQAVKKKHFMLLHAVLGWRLKADAAAHDEALPKAFKRWLSPLNIEQTLRRLCRLVGLHPSILDRYVSTCSGGEKQRCALLRALLYGPSVLILDEPTASLDAHSAYLVLRLLGFVQRHYPISYIVITHDVRLAQAFGDRMLLLHNKRVIAQGSFHRLSLIRHGYGKEFYDVAKRFGAL